MPPPGLLPVNLLAALLQPQCSAILPTVQSQNALYSVNGFTEYKLFYDWQEERRSEQKDRTAAV